MRYLVDSDWLIDTMHGQPGAAETLEHFSSEGLAVSIITIGELFHGAFSRTDIEGHLAEIRELVESYTILGLTESVMLEFARMRFALRRQGQSLADLDLLIAATAMHHDLTLITRNIRHFSRIRGLPIYALDDD